MRPGGSIVVRCFGSRRSTRLTDGCWLSSVGSGAASRPRYGPAGPDLTSSQLGPDFTALDALLANLHSVDDDGLAELRLLASMRGPDPERVAAAADRLRAAVRVVASVRGTSAEDATHRADLLDRALGHLARHAGDTACPVCGTAGVLDASWAAHRPGPWSGHRGADGLTQRLEAWMFLDSPRPVQQPRREGGDSRAALARQPQRLRVAELEHDGPVQWLRVERRDPAEVEAHPPAVGIAEDSLRGEQNLGGLLLPPAKRGGGQGRVAARAVARGG